MRSQPRDKSKWARESKLWGRRAKCVPGMDQQAMGLGPSCSGVADEFEEVVGGKTVRPFPARLRSTASGVSGGC